MFGDVFICEFPFTSSAAFVVRQKRGNPARGRKLLAAIRQRIKTAAPK
jgi:hypothetical protein